MIRYTVDSVAIGSCLNSAKLPLTNLHNLYLEDFCSMFPLGVVAGDIVLWQEFSGRSRSDLGEKMSSLRKVQLKTSIQRFGAGSQKFRFYIYRRFFCSNKENLTFHPMTFDIPTTFTHSLSNFRQLLTCTVSKTNITLPQHLKLLTISRHKR